MRRVGLARHMDQVDLGHLEPRERRLDLRFRGGGAGLRRAARGNARDDQEELVLNPELVGNRGGDLLRPRDRLVHRVEESAAVVDQRLEDLLERGVIRGVRVPELEADDREHLTGRRNGPLNELSARLLKCAEQLRSERQRSAGAEGRAKKFTT